MAFDCTTDLALHTPDVDGLRPETSLLNGAYRVTETLSSGGFGLVYLAKDALDRTVVLKECFPATLSRRDGTMVVPVASDDCPRFAAVQRCFQTEGQILARLDHPNIVRLRKLFRENGTGYMAMDRLHGTDLLDLIEHKTRVLSPSDIVGIARKLIATLGYLHQQGILHCDVATDNVVLSPSNEPVLIDFGAARPVTPEPGRAYAGPRVVKDGYSPPEQYLTNAVMDVTGDLYALAASLYHLISGTLPASGDQRLAALEAGDLDPCAPLAGAFLGYPAGFLAAIDTAMSITPSARFHSAEQWLAAQHLPTKTLPTLRLDRPVLLLRRSMALPQNAPRSLPAIMPPSARISLGRAEAALHR